MTKAASLTLGLIVCIATSASLRAQPAQDPSQEATDEAVRRQEATMRMQFKLADAEAAQKRNELNQAAKFYQEAYALFPYVTSGSVAVEQEKSQVLAGLIAVRMQMAQAAK